jgi:gliding motility-associated-like protein
MKINLRKSLLAMMLLIGGCSVFSQKQQDPLGVTQSELAQRSIQETGYVRCSTVEMDAIRRAKYPDMQTQDDFENWLAPLIEAKKLEIEQLSSVGSFMSTVINIPIIFHIITDGTMPTNIAASQVQAQIDQLNLDFNNLSGSSYGVAASADINFIPAMVDPSGAALTEPGVNRITTFGAGPFPSSDFDVGNGGLEIKSTGWDYNLYANVWVAGLTGGLLGYAQFPSNSTLPGLADDGGPTINSGVVCGTGTIGSVANPGTAAPYNLGRTLTHEIGHWIGLRHIWGDGGCSVDDYCADTPNAGGSNFGCATGNDSCPSDAGTDMVENYMDYSDDACMDTFTADQVLRIITVMENADGLINLPNSTTGSIDYTMNFVATDIEVCETASDPVYTFDYVTSDDFSDTVSFSSVVSPAGPTVVFSQPNANTDTNGITATVSGASSGVYTITVTGSYGSETKDVELNLEVLASALATPVLTAPVDAATNVADHTLIWNVITNASSYDVNIYDDAGLSNLIESSTGVTTTSYEATTLAIQTTYYWTVTANNGVCGTSSSVSGAFSFETANLACETQAASDTPIAIPDGLGVETEGDPAVSTLNYTIAKAITDVNVIIGSITHTYAQDLRLVLTSPSGTSVELTSQNGVGVDDAYTGTVFDDAAVTAIDEATAPFTGLYIPENPLSVFNGESSSGDWTLSVYDNWNVDTGNLVAWSIEICGEPMADADSDGVPDVIDNCVDNANPLQEDIDADGVGDVCDNCPDTPNPDQADMENDGVGDACQVYDADGDGVLDAVDNCPDTPNSDQADVDGDGVGDVCDNCPNAPNPDQTDVNNNNIGDICESITPADTITPNGDLQNDKWFIKNLEDQTSSSVKVFNRWGVKVFDAINYVNNTWGGESTEGGSGLLPAGSYYYVIEYVTSNGVVMTSKGWMYINY